MVTSEEQDAQDQGKLTMVKFEAELTMVKFEAELNRELHNGELVQGSWYEMTCELTDITGRAFYQHRDESGTLVWNQAKYFR